MVKFNIIGKIHRIYILKHGKYLLGIRVVYQEKQAGCLTYDIHVDTLKEIGIKDPQFFCDTLTNMCSDVEILELLQFKEVWCTLLENRTGLVIPTYHYREKDDISNHLLCLWNNHIQYAVNQRKLSKGIVAFSAPNLMGTSSFILWGGRIHFAGQSERAAYVGTFVNHPLDFKQIKDFGCEESKLKIQETTYDIVRYMMGFRIES